MFSKYCADLEILSQIYKKTNQKKQQLAVLLDPDELSEQEKLERTIALANSAQVDYFFIGGSLITRSNMDKCVKYIKSNSSIPLILFPGSLSQLHPEVDALLFLSLISGRNPELLIGTQVLAAPIIKSMKLEALSTGYMLVDCGKPTTASYMSNTPPIPFNKNQIATSTAMAGEMLGLKLIYLDGGSGAEKPIAASMITEVKQNITVPLIVGGGIRNIESATLAWNAGADIVVIGNAIEENPDFISEFSRL